MKVHLNSVLLYNILVTPERYPSDLNQKLGKGSECRERILEKKMKSNGSECLKPVRVYPYKSVISSVQEFFLRSDFEDTLKVTRNKNQDEDFYGDIHDGAMWTEQLDCFGMPFCSGANSVSFSLNIDWFQPFDNIVYSCGVIYLSVNNIPRKDRYKEENILLVGIMPGGKEAKTDRINAYLAPLVDELLLLISGIKMKTFKNPRGVVVYGALLLAGISNLSSISSLILSQGVIPMI